MKLVAAEMGHVVEVVEAGERAGWSPKVILLVVGHAVGALDEAEALAIAEALRVAARKLAEAR
jgi:hypothetical protein